MFIQSADGAKLAIHTTGHGPSILFVHGTAGDHHDWDRVIDRLPGFRCHAMDRRGRSASTDGKAHSLEAEAQDIHAAVAATHADAIVAHSFGALATLEAIARPTVPCLLYEPPFTDAGNPAAAAPLEAALKGRDHNKVLELFLTDFAGMHPADVAQFRRSDEWRQAVTHAGTIPREVRAFLGFRFRPERYRAVPPFVSLLTGAQSPPMFGIATEKVAAAFRAPVHVLPRQGHEALQTAPEEVARQVVAFMAYVQRKAGRRVAPA